NARGSGAWIQRMDPAHGSGARSWHERLARRDDHIDRRSRPRARHRAFRAAFRGLPCVGMSHPHPPPWQRPQPPAAAGRPPGYGPQGPALPGSQGPPHQGPPGALRPGPAGHAPGREVNSNLVIRMLVGIPLTLLGGLVLLVIAVVPMFALDD